MRDGLSATISRNIDDHPSQVTQSIIIIFSLNLSIHQQGDDQGRQSGHHFKKVRKKFVYIH